MSNHTGVSPKDPNKYLGPNVFLTLCVTRNRAPTSADFRQPETGKLYPFSSFWLVGKDPTTGVQGDLWYLSKIAANVAYWVKISSGGGGPAIMFPVPNGTSPVVADVSGNVTLTSSAGTITITGGLNTINFDLAGGGIAVDQIAVQAITAPGVTPVTPTAAGLITVNGNPVANHSVPIETRSRALNAYNIEVQYGTSAAATDATKSGLAHFNSAQFTVDANGFVALSGGGLAIDSLGVQATSGAGTNPVLPDGTGKIEIQGALVAAGTNPLRSVSTAANTLQMQVQTSQALAATDSTKVGLSNYQTTDFIVDVNGFVSLNPIATPTNGVNNLGISYNAGTGTFTVNGYNGAALSATNPAIIWTQSKSVPGRLVKYIVTANQDFIDDNGASEIIGNLFGLTTSIATTVDLPFFLYACTNDSENTITFGCSRIPHMSVAPIAANIGKPTSAIADTQGSLFLFENVTVGDYDGNPLLNLGSFRMRMSASDDWTVQTLAVGQDGIGRFQEGIQFDFPRGQYGSATGKVFANNGGTAPDDADGGYGYYVQKDGFCNAKVAFPLIDTAGVGAVLATLLTPYAADGSTIGSGFFNVGGNFAILSMNMSANNVSTCGAILQVSNLSAALLTNANVGLNAVVSTFTYYKISLL